MKYAGAMVRYAGYAMILVPIGMALDLPSWGRLCMLCGAGLLAGFGTNADDNE